MALLDTAFMIVTATSLLAAGLFLVLASGIFHELSIVGTRPIYTLSFLALSALGTIGVLFDHVSIALRRSDQVLSRNVLFGLITLATMALLSLLFGATSSLAIFSAWVMGNLAACLLGCVQLWRALLHYRWQARVEWGLTRLLLSIGFPNYMLTLAERAPGSIMPIVVTELLSPVANAYWYPVWMMGWGVLIIPISIGQTLFAEAAHRPESLREEVRHSLRSSLAFGFLAAAVAGLLAPFMLSLLGPNYAAAGTTPLRILVIGVLPFAFIQAYYSACRARRRLREAVLTGLLSGFGSIGGAAAIGVSYGIVGIAVAWVVAQFVTGLWAAWRLLVLARQERLEMNG
jgi:O-antigen/teichoic acid export membrane protein